MKKSLIFAFCLFLTYVGEAHEVNYDNGKFGIGIDAESRLHVAEGKDGLYSIFDTFSTNYDNHTVLWLRKSHSNTVGTLEETVMGSYLGAIFFSATNQQDQHMLRDAVIYVQQVNAAGWNYSDTRMVLETANALTGLNAFQLVLEYNGYVGINCIPTERFHVSDSSAWGPVALIENTNADATSGYLRFIKKSNTPADNDFVGVIDFRSNDSTKVMTSVAYIAGYVSDVTNGSVCGKLQFRVKVNNTDTNMIEINGVTKTIENKFQTKIVQPDTSGDKVVAELEQLDLDAPFIDFIGDYTTDGSKSISLDTKEDSSKYGAIRVKINGTTKWIRVYDNPD